MCWRGGKESSVVSLRVLIQYPIGSAEDQPRSLRAVGLTSSTLVDRKDALMQNWTVPLRAKYFMLRLQLVVQ